jgi:hypothetical protein
MSRSSTAQQQSRNASHSRHSFGTVMAGKTVCTQMTRGTACWPQWRRRVSTRARLATQGAQAVRSTR